MSKFDALFVGAGLFNAVMASEFVKAGKKVLVLERREHAGGNCSTNVDFTRRIEHRHFMSDSQQKYGIEKDCTIVTTEYPAKMTEGSEAYYPVVNSESNAMYSKYIHMKPKDVEFTGRLGKFEYNDMDDTISKALCESALYTR